jgi:hypothetical protein
MLNPVQRKCREALWNGPQAIGWGGPKSGQPSGLRQAKATNNVTIWGFVRQSERQPQGNFFLTVCKLMHKKGIESCAAKVTSGGERGMRLAFNWAVPRQGYGRN